MALFEKGITFLDFRAVNIQGGKPKYFIALTPGDYDDDHIVCCVFNTEKRPDLIDCCGCNKRLNKYIIQPGSFSFIKVHTAIDLVPLSYLLKDILCSSHIKILDSSDIASDLLCRRIKNCMDKQYIPLKFNNILKETYK